MGFTAKLGEHVRDKVTGFSGIATARCEYLHGSTQVRVQAVGGNELSDHWFEEGRLESHEI